MSPRRSSRARTTQGGPPSGPTLTNSSSSSVSSSLPNGTGSYHKLPSPRSSAAARSQSSEDPEGSAKPQPRRTRSSQEDIKEQSAATIDDEIEDDGEEEVTRCICGNQEYPGLPVSVRDSTIGVSKTDLDPPSFAEDATGWFIQCDACKVWQHGGCVGIADEATSPEEYFCEQCRKDLHKITATSNGRKYSLYIPIQQSKSLETSPTPTRQANSKKSRERKTSQVNPEGLLKGRRLTMNSRDAAYEEEQLRRAIEESKREGGVASTDTGTRKAKRSRSESEDPSENSKRQRTTSGSGSSSNSRRQNPESEEEVEKSERYKNIRGAAARNHRIKEVREQEVQREKERVESEGTKHRVGREGGDELDPSPEPLFRTTSTRGAKVNATSFLPPPPPPPPDNLAPKVSYRKTGRPPTRGRGRIGRNQYTKDRDFPSKSDNATTTISPAPSSHCHDDSGVPHVNGNSIGYADGNGIGKPSKPRHMNPNRITMNEMKRRVAGILEFVSHTQVEMAGTGPPSTTKSSTSSNTPPHTNGSHSQNGAAALSEKAVAAALQDLEGIDDQAFAALSSVDMMEVLTKRLMRWQAEYGKWGDK